MANEDDLNRIVDTGRAALAGSEPAPDDVADLAKQALAFRDVPTVPTTPASELVGIRSGAVAEAHRVMHGESSLLWSRVDDVITGVLESDTVGRLRFHTLDDTVDVDLDFIGTFEVTAPGGAYRFIIDDTDGPWATDWHN